MQHMQRLTCLQDKSSDLEDWELNNVILSLTVIYASM